MRRRRQVEGGPQMRLVWDVRRVGEVLKEEREMNGHGQRRSA